MKNKNTDKIPYRTYTTSNDVLKTSPYLMKKSWVQDTLRYFENNEDRFNAILFDLQNNKPNPTDKKELMKYFLVHQTCELTFNLINYLREEYKDFDEKNKSVYFTKKFINQYIYKYDDSIKWLKLYYLLDCPIILRLFIPELKNHDDIVDEFNFESIPEIKNYFIKISKKFDDISTFYIFKSLTPEDYKILFNICDENELKYLNEIKSHLPSSEYKKITTLNDYLIKKIAFFIVLNFN